MKISHVTTTGGCGNWVCCVCAAGLLLSRAAGSNCVLRCVLLLLLLLLLARFGDPVPDRKGGSLLLLEVGCIVGNKFVNFRSKIEVSVLV